MNKNLTAEASMKYILGLILFALLTFIPAGTLHYPQGWLLMAVLFIPMLGVGIFLLARNPQLLRKRLNDKETQSEQKKVVLLSMLIYTGGTQCKIWLVYPAHVGIMDCSGHFSGSLSDVCRGCPGK